MGWWWGVLILFVCHSLTSSPPPPPPLLLVDTLTRNSANIIDFRDGGNRNVFIGTAGTTPHLRVAIRNGGGTVTLQADNHFANARDDFVHT